MKRYFFLLATLLCAVSVQAQDPATGFPPFGSFENGRFDGINRQNLNVNFAIPIMGSPGRGMDLGHLIAYDSLIWVRNSNSWQRVVDENGLPTWGWKLDRVIGTIKYKVRTSQCYDFGGEPGGILKTYDNYSYTDRAGTRHDFPGVVIYWSGCDASWSGDFTAYASDNSGYYIDANSATAPFVYSPSGIKITNTGNIYDTNGNFISSSTAANVTTWKDTRGNDALKIDKATANFIYYRFLDSTGAYQTITLALQTFNIKTNFACSGVAEYTGTASLPVSITLPNSQSYSFTYEDTPGFSGYKTGRLKRVTLPTGGYYEYQYPTTGNKGINCADGTGTSLTRLISDGTTTSTWQLVRAQVGQDWKTTVTDPVLPYDSGVANQSVFTFTNGRESSALFYQGNEFMYQLLRTINTTWAANNTPASKTIIEGSNQVKIETDFDTYGKLIEVREYHFGGSTPARTTHNTYLTDSTYVSRNILDRLTQVVVRDGGATGTIKSQTDIAYDEATYINTLCPAGASQHDDTNYPCTLSPRGLPTTVSTYANVAAQTGRIDRHISYDWFGNRVKADVNGSQQKQWSCSAPL
ncbi:MAG: hypothetical protein HY234_10680 [Acidobacteria bacterium]|nr:hypothetical protein [Acidobacteriota bacterium]MBI3663496.1 hypothetical protein [Acidobacteriota bacterium]